MKIKFLLTGILLAITATTVTAQTNRSFAVTGNAKGAINWSFLREIDMNTATIMRDINFQPQQTNYYDAQTKLPVVSNDISHPLTKVVQGVNLNEPAADMIAAIAFDANTNRLYYTYMHGTDLRYVDLNASEPKQYVVRNAPLKQFTPAQGEEDVITRMSFASDGYGYALTNNGNHLIRFSSGEKITIRDLGAITDGKNNGQNSVTNIASYGGDMVGDAFGSLYLFAQRGIVFKINLSTLVADYIGAVTNLPEGFTINGTAADDNNNVIVSCATDAENYYSVNMFNLKATVLPKKNEVYNTSDLASRNLLFQSQPAKQVTAEEAFITIYPNPVKNRTFEVAFNKIAKGNYSMELLDATGMPVLKKDVNIIPGQVENIRLPANVTSGAYMLRIANKAAQDKLYTTSVLVGM